MVGVPGRSKACVTCRTRRKGCDLRTPTCGQCERRGIVCGGYDLYRMWITHTAVPTKKITRIRSFSNRRNNATISSSDAFSTRTAPFQALSPSHPNGMGCYSLATSAHTSNIVELFFNMWNPDNDNASDQMATHHVDGFENMMSSLYVQDEALRLALLAIGTGLLGKKKNDENLVRQGRILYGRGLKEMGNALTDPRRAHSEAILAVPRINGLFEMVFGADKDITVQAQSWLSHARGLITMYTARRPESYIDGVAHNLFKDGRKTVIIRDIRARKASTLNEKPWKTIPWTKHPKTPKDLFMDNLASIPEILSNIDDLA
ncbi:hypothetical protein P280DRAFT_424988, partial [Massarina eburnea CBS 473.64]